MDCSVIIPTLNRPKELEVTIRSILEQTVLPKEIIIVDQGNLGETTQVIQDLEKENSFKKKAILKHIYLGKKRSLTVARNEGVRHANGDIILFLDDDVILHSNFVSNILEVYKRHPAALGVQGFITGAEHEHFSKLMHCINKIFYLYHMEKNTWKVLPSGFNTYPYPLTKEINCQSCSGCCCCYKKSVFGTFKFDERLILYAYNEDTDFSYRIYKKFPNSLFITPYAKLIHKTSPEARLPSRIQTYMEAVYMSYFFFKNVKITIRNIAIFAWSRLGFLLTVLASGIIRGGKKSELINSYFTIRSYVFVLTHLRNIREGELGFFNRLATK